MTTHVISTYCVKHPVSNYIETYSAKYELSVDSVRCCSYVEYVSCFFPMFVNDAPLVVDAESYVPRCQSAIGRWFTNHIKYDVVRRFFVRNF